MSFTRIHSFRFVLFFIFAVLVSSETRAAPLKQTQNGKVFMGGLPPRLLNLDVVGQVRKDSLLYYKLKATVKRASGDNNGTMLLLKSQTWSEALSTLAGGDPELRKSLKILFPDQWKSKEKFPALRLRYRYRLTFLGVGIGSKKARKALGNKKFVEPIAFGVRPGLHTINLDSCVEMDEHPILSAYNIASVMIALANLKSFLTPMGVAKAVFLNAVKKYLTCSTVQYQYDLKAKVPPLIGLTPSAAKKELDAHNLGVKWIKTTCSSVKAKVTKQSPAAGRYLSAGEVVTVTYCVKDPTDGGGGGGTSGKYVVYVRPDLLTCCTEANGRLTYRFLWGIEGTLPANAIPVKGGFSSYDALEKWVCDRSVYYHYWARNWAYIEDYKISMLPCDINA